MLGTETQKSTRHVSACRKLEPVLRQVIAGQCAPRESSREGVPGKCLLNKNSGWGGLRVCSCWLLRTQTVVWESMGVLQVHGEARGEQWRLHCAAPGWVTLSQQLLLTAPVSPNASAYCFCPQSFWCIYPDVVYCSSVADGLSSLAFGWLYS